VTGHFNSDMTTDLIIVTANGSSEFFGSSGGFVAGPWVRNDLTFRSPDLTPVSLISPRSGGLTLGNVQYVTGNFDGDFVTDLIIVTATGSYEYLDYGASGFLAGFWVRNDLTLGKVQYVSGGFRSDAITDLIIVTASGTYEYLNSGGGFVPFTP
jgi:hypothetical protein